MNVQRKWIIVLVIALVAVSLACNLINLINPPAEEPLAEVLELAQDVQDEPQEQDAQAQTEPEQPTQAVLPTEAPVSAPWLVAVGDTSITYLIESDMLSRTITVEGYIVTAVPSPAGGKVAIVRSEKVDHDGMLWFDLLDLATGELTTITPLANSQNVMLGWETAEICQPPREANFATIYTPPVWTPDGSAVVFISAQEGLYARPYTYDIAAGQIIDLSLGGEVHYYHLSMSPDGQFITMASATCFGTGAGLEMASFSYARVSGGEAGLLLDVSDASNLLSWGWLDDRSIVFSTGDIWAHAKNLRAIDIQTGQITEITGPNDYVDTVAVADGLGTLMFTTQMSSLAEYVEGETITKDALFYWNRNAGYYTELNDQVVWGSSVEWDQNMHCYYADLSNGGEEAEWIQTYTVDGGLSDACPPVGGNVVNIPHFDASHQFYAWTVQNWSQPEQDALNVQGLVNSAATQVINAPAESVWHPTKQILTYANGSGLYYAAPPDFVSNAVLHSPEDIIDFFWVTP